MASQTQGIQQLLAAEKRAAEKVAEAKKRKARRLKQAKEEAQEEIERYKQDRERQFKEFEAQHMGSREDVAARIDADTRQRIEEMTKAVNVNKEPKTVPDEMNGIRAKTPSTPLEKSVLEWSKSERLHKYWPVFSNMRYDQLVNMREENLDSLLRQIGALPITTGARKRILNRGTTHVRPRLRQIRGKDRPNRRRPMMKTGQKPNCPRPPRLFLTLCSSTT
ncbi:unnamed protein product, partial [Nesidiocoris tenuis]